MRKKDQINRIERFQQLLHIYGFDGAIITSSVNRHYLTYGNIGAGCLLITAQESLYITDGRFFETAKERLSDCQIHEHADPIGETLRIAKSLNLSACAVENQTLPLALFTRFKKELPNTSFSLEVGADDLIWQLRKIKDAWELSCLRQAQEIADAAYTHILDYIRPGLTETDIRMELGTYMVKLGSENHGINFIVSSGSRTACPHGADGNRMINAGDFVMMDFGGRISGYDSDMTRTVAVGYASEDMKHVYETVRRAQALGISLLKPGITGRSIHFAVKALIEHAGYAGCFNHGLGHSLGLEIHENPRCNPYDNTALEAGEMMTVEPGIYLPGNFGVRIEDMGVITHQGFEDFTKSSHELIVLT